MSVLEKEIWRVEVKDRVCPRRGPGTRLRMREEASKAISSLIRVIGGPHLRGGKSGAVLVYLSLSPFRYLTFRYETRSHSDNQPLLSYNIALSVTSLHVGSVQPDTGGVSYHGTLVGGLSHIFGAKMPEGSCYPET